jgi:hypothetical protein
MSRWLTTVAPTLTSATFVPRILPDAQSKNIAYGHPDARRGRLASRTPMPGTMTTSCLRTQRAVRPTSSTLPSSLSGIAVTPDAAGPYFRYQCSGTASMP